MSPVLESAILSEREEMWKGLYRAEKIKPNPLLASQETQMKPNGTTHVTIPPKDGESSKIYPAGLLSRLKLQARPSVVLILILIITIIILIIALIALSAKKSEPCSAGPACPDGWIGYLGKCYYFSETEGNWTYSQNNCSALGASLAVIDTQQEMNFMMHYKDIPNYWIGLWRDLNQPWKWASGTEFSNWFTIAGGGSCAFLNSGDVSSSGCSRDARWICSKPTEKPEGRAK
ncbi:early activation antigen CD69-like [Dermochelys coriacea]|uniref:early activation antigen CD69-like n=1 Tax=Dermochelys coriacea TaxID=27794 RepID=UPI0018E769E0|nr:early activation antigen CD69-like [Dermochelys coriacea]XP_038226763.1 early activation antigen CD69-like [Dermochelys coriacea]